jgi:hypothetical protein
VRSTLIGPEELKAGAESDAARGDRGDETIYQRDYRIGSALKKISDENAGMSLLVNHHDRKAQADDFVDTISGSHGAAKCW